MAHPQPSKHPGDLEAGALFLDPFQDGVSFCIFGGLLDEGLMSSITDSTPQMLSNSKPGKALIPSKPKLSKP